MKRTAMFLVFALGSLLLAVPYASAQSDTGQTAAITPDSLKKFCRALFLNNCAGCHGEKGQGTVGPNLTDKFWLHGGGSRNIGATIKEGVPGKGMISWDAVFSAQELHQIAECVLMLQGTDPRKAKKPEGEPSEEKKN